MLGSTSGSSRHHLHALGALAGAGVLTLATSLLPLTTWAQSPSPTGTARPAATAGAQPPAASPSGAPAGGAAPSASPAAAATDFAQHGVPTVAGTAQFTPGSSTTVSGANQTVTVAGNFYTDPATIDLLTGPPASFSSAAGGDTVLVAFAFRVTDKTTGQLVGTGFGAAFQYTYTGPAVNAATVRFNVSPATPPAVTLSGPPTISGTTASLSFMSAAVGWLLANPPSAAAPSTSAAAVPRPASPPNTGVGPGPVRTGLRPPAQAAVTSAALPPSEAAAGVSALPQLPLTGSGGLLGGGQPGGASGLAAGLLVFSAALLLAGAVSLQRSGG